MAIRDFPYEFKPWNGGIAIISVIPGEPFHFNFEIKDKKGRTESFSWKATREEVVNNRVIRKHEYSKFAYVVLVGFWYLYND